MFGMGFLEILLVAIIAIIALGPEKLPSAMVDMAKMLKKLKSGLDDAKSSLDEELKITDMKAEANKFKAQFEEAKSTISVNKADLGIDNLNSDLNLNTLLEDDTEAKPKKEKKKSVKKVKKEQVVSENSDDTNKFKVNFDDDTNKESV